MVERRAQELLGLLEQERAALLKGDYVDLDRIAPAKQKLLARLADQALSDAGMKRVSHAIRRNQSLLAAAIDGMRAAQGKMSRLREQRSGFSTYDRSGHRHTVGGAPSVIERKA